jgi:hypothetical protein
LLVVAPLEATVFEIADFPLREALAIRSRAGKDARGVLQFPF